jgi:hypothetical protein
MRPQAQDVSPNRRLGLFSGAATRARGESTRDRDRDGERRGMMRAVSQWNGGSCFARRSGQVRFILTENTLAENPELALSRQIDYEVCAQTRSRGCAVIP